MPPVIELIQDAQSFELLREEWEALLQASAANGLFLTWEWLATWWKHFSVERELFVLTARASGELMAIAPGTGGCPFVSLGWRSVRRSRRARASTTSCTVTKSTSSGGRGRSGS